MEDLLYFIAQCRNYKMKYVWECPCGRKTNLFMHRSDEEYKQGLSNVKQVCTEKHVTRPRKFCNKCNREGAVEDVTCEACEPSVLVLAEERMEKEIGHKTS